MMASMSAVRRSTPFGSSSIDNTFWQPVRSALAVASTSSFLAIVQLRKAIKPAQFRPGLRAQSLLPCYSHCLLRCVAIRRIAYR